MELRNISKTRHSSSCTTELPNYFYEHSFFVSHVSLNIRIGMRFTKNLYIIVIFVYYRNNFFRGYFIEVS